MESRLIFLRHLRGPMGGRCVNSDRATRSARRQTQGRGRKIRHNSAEISLEFLDNEVISSVTKKSLDGLKRE